MTGVSSVLVFCCGFLVHFPRPFAFNGVIGSGFLDRTAPFDLVLGLTILACILRRGIAMPGRAYVGWLMLLVSGLISSLGSSRGLSDEALIISFAIAAGALLPAAIGTTQHLKAFTTGYITGAFALSIVLLYDSGALLAGYAPLYFEITRRLRGPFYLSSQAGQHIAASIFLLLAFSRSHIGRLRTIGVATAAVMVVPLVLTGRRTALFAALLGLTLLLIWVGRRSVLVSATGIAMLIGCGMLVGGAEDGYLATVRARVMSIGNVDPETSFTSMQAAAALQAFESSPVIGIGPGQFQLSIFDPSGNELHSVFSKVLAEYGAVGIFSLLVALSVTAFHCVSLCRRCRKVDELTAVCLSLCVLVCYIGTVHNVIMRERSFWIAVAAVTVYSTRLRAAAAVPAQLYLPPRYVPA
ncbi:MAG TPA: O-antigen ligase family protein [Bryobacteraceae bacterium]|nr:O-antigen ligase family protein [Bryobacteraceae bacterium]